MEAERLLAEQARWGDDLAVELRLDVLCPEGRLQGLRVAEALPPGMRRLEGHGPAPAMDAPGAPRWERMGAEGDWRLSYRLLVSPESVTPALGAWDPEPPEPLAWPLLLDLRLDDRWERAALPPMPPLRVDPAPPGPRCGISRSRALPEGSVALGAPARVGLRLRITGCPPQALRSRALLAFQPLADPAEQAGVVAALASLIADPEALPDDRIFGALTVEGGSPRLVEPSAAIGAAETALRAAPAPDGAGPTDAALLGAAAESAAGLPGQHDLLLMVTHAAAPPAPPGALAAAREAAAAASLELLLVCLGASACDPALGPVERVADARALRASIAALFAAHRGPPLRLAGLRVEEPLHPFWSVDPEGASPPAALRGDGTLAWEGLAAAPGEAIELVYDLRAPLWGRLPLGSPGRATLLHEGGGRSEASLPSGAIEVRPDPLGRAAPCRLWTSSVARPARLPRGTEVEVRRAWSASCPEGPGALDLVVALDASGSMAGPRWRAALAALEGFLAVLAPEAQSGAIGVGLVAFAESPRAERPLSAETGSLLAGLDGLAPRGQTAVHAGLDAAAALAAGGRAGARPAVLLISDGWSDEAPMRAAAERLRGAGTRLLTLCPAPGCHPALPEIASSPAEHLEAPDDAALASTLAGLAARLRARPLAALELRAELPPHAPAAGTAAPPAAEADEAGLRWRFEPPSPLGDEVRYTLRPLRLGPQPLGRALALFRDAEGREGRADLAAPEVSTWLPPPSGPCRLTEEAEAGPDPVRAGAEVAARLAVALDCGRAAPPLEVLLLIDRSASMAGLGRMDAARDAAGAFLAALPPGGEARAGLLAFADQPGPRLPLGSTPEEIREALAAIEPAGGTDIAGALRAGRALLAARRPEARPVLLLLTDGETSTGEAGMLAAAAELEADGVQRVTVCAGRCDAALPRVASAPELAFQAAPEDLPALYAELAGRLAGGLAGGELRLRFAPSLPPEPGSLAPPPDAESGDEALWRLRADAPLTVTWRARPLRGGTQPLLGRAALRYRTVGGAPGAAELLGPEVVVLGGTPTTAPPPWPSPVATPGPGGRLFLPRAERRP